MIKAICTTTIYKPSEAMLEFARIAERDDWHLIIAGDMKTPHEAYIGMQKDYPHLTYLHPNEQKKRWPRLSELIGFGCIQRRNFAYLAAHELGADIFASVDDDNIALDGWGQNLMVGYPTLVKYHVTEQPAFDPIGVTNYPHLWHRGFPVELVSSRYSKRSTTTVTPDIQADFWNGNPDIGAMCRMEHAPHCRFSDAAFPMASNMPSPFNSQNTFLTKEVMPHYFLMNGIGRYDDIWAGLYVQAKGFRVVYGRTSVVQDRNEHNLMKDFDGEIFGERNTLNLIKAMATDPEVIHDFLPPAASEAFKEYQKHYE